MNSHRLHKPYSKFTAIKLAAEGHNERKSVYFNNFLYIIKISFLILTFRISYI
jgi:hypothetical protein